VIVLAGWMACGGDDPAGRTPPDGTAATGETGDGVTTTGATGGTGDTAATGASTGDTACACDDGLDCSDDSCDASGRCVATPLYDCAWPAAPPEYAIPLGGLDPDGDLLYSVSDGYWNVDARRLWVVRNSGPSGIWRLREDGLGGWAVDLDAGGALAEWKDLGLGDIEGLTQLDPVGAPSVVTVVDEELGHVVSYDLATAGAAPEVARWDLSAWIAPAGALGAEATAFVPDAALASWGFTDAAGAPRTSAAGLGGLVLVGMQTGGEVVAFDLAPGGVGSTWVGAYGTARPETSGLYWDAATERLYLWHGGMTNDAEVARLSSTDVGLPNRKLETEVVFDYPLGGNVEGIAVLANADCGPVGRPLFLLQDTIGERAIQLYPDWTPGCPP
jgi:hypothetical protein